MSAIRPRTNPIRAFTLLELISIIFVTLCIVGIVFFRPFKRSSAKSPRIQCVNNLKNVGLAYRIYAMDNAERFPWETAEQRSAMYYYLSVSHELSTPKILHCPTDTRKLTTNWPAITRENISYFLNLNSTQTDPQLILGGDRNLLINGVTLTRKRAEIPHTAHLAWTAAQHKNQGNTAMSDGSVYQLSDARLREQWRITATNTSNKPATFLFP